VSYPSDLGPLVDARPDLRRTRGALLALLAELTPQQWRRETAAAPWLVRDVVAHLLGDDVGRISRGRDGHPTLSPGADETLPVFLDRINDEWVRAMVRASPHVLLALLGTTSQHVLAYWDSLDLAVIGGPVSWAGPGPAPTWLDCAREFTEDWVHQQQIRAAVGIPGLTDPATLHRVLDTFLHAIPYTLSRHGHAGGTLTIAVDGVGRWCWQGAADRWRRSDEAGQTVVSVDASTLWRVAVRMIEPEQALARAHVEGDQTLAAAALQLVSIIR
jgi:uncharacterized protein (TIGR03083 family)